MSYAIKYDIGDFERSLGELIKKLGNRAPLMREMAAAMGDAVEENFAQQGRPASHPTRRRSTPWRHARHRASPV